VNTGNNGDVQPQQDYLVLAPPRGLLGHARRKRRRRWRRRR
jgi:hypothetical protein